ncbi:unnamed protein product [Prorocentrum cordatum]|uniref:Uncharacterized protein n=1 Tax=Prorocentrum cordatum TaxID=2364126 RepID=A0ABN9RIN0_9DINO|nr:unnamed protein product [Polarella glacialis]
MEQRLAATALGTLGSPAKCLGAYLMQDRRSSSASGNGASPSGSGCTWRFCGCPFSCLDLCLFYLIVDQFEELLKKYPEESEAVPWADAITNYHVRNNLARVVFVVNSDAAAQTLHNLDWRGHTRYKRVRMEPSTPDQVWMVPTIDPKLFSQCECNIGLYHLVCRALDNGIITRADVPRYVQRHLTRWELEFQAPWHRRHAFALFGLVNVSLQSSSPCSHQATMIRNEWDFICRDSASNHISDRDPGNGPEARAPPQPTELHISPSGLCPRDARFCSCCPRPAAPPLMLRGQVWRQGRGHLCCRSSNAWRCRSRSFWTPPGSTCPCRMPSGPSCGVWRASCTIARGRIRRGRQRGDRCDHGRGAAGCQEARREAVLPEAGGPLSPSGGRCSRTSGVSRRRHQGCPARTRT